MAFRMRRMVLINLGTNQHIPSGRITEIDPRGGAAVMGENGVGKTTTLRLVPLFFGHLPSQIVAAGQGREAMIRFVLPTGASAIAFEYQRGSDSEEDIRLAVIRRRDDGSDAPEYRIYKTRFCKELFVDEGRFLDDDETEERMRSRSIQGTRKLTPADYRCVILRTKSNTKEADRIRRYSLEYSFGPKALPNLDRLVAAMVKKHINFQDFVQVAVGMVQEDLGLGGDRSKLSMKQGRAQIERWLRNRDACEDAFKLAPAVQELQSKLGEHRVAEARFRELRADVLAVKNARKREQSQIENAITSLVEARGDFEIEEGRKRIGLAEASASAQTNAAETKITFEAAAAQATYFETERATHWETQVEGLSALVLQKNGLDDQVKVASIANDEATIKYTKLWERVEAEANIESLNLEVTKNPHQERYDQALVDINEVKRFADDELDVELNAKDGHLNELLGPLNQQIGALQLTVENPQPSKELLQAADEAGSFLQKHTELVSAAATAFSSSSAVELTALAAFEQREQEKRVAGGRVVDAERALAFVHARLSPAHGTLQAVLRAQSGEAWKKTLARVIDPELLLRSDLEPQFLEASDALYGWSIRTEAITSPDWTNDSTLRIAVTDADASLRAAQEHAAATDVALPAASRELDAARAIKNEAEANHGVLVGKTEGLKANQATARGRVTVSAQEAKSYAAGELVKVNQQVIEIKRQLDDLGSERIRRKKELASMAVTQRDLAKEQRRIAIKAIDDSIQAIRQSAASQSSDLKDQLDAHLSESGVDIKRLGELKAMVDGIRIDIETREGKLSLVERWRKWIFEGGATRVGQHKLTATNAANLALETTGKLSEFDAAAVKAKGAHNNAVSAKNARLEVVIQEQSVLRGLDDEFGDYQPQHHAAVDVNITAKEMRTCVMADRQLIDVMARAINKQANDIRTALTTRDSAVKELIDASLTRVADHGEISRASELCLCYKLIGPQVVTDVNTTLKAVLSNIGQFRKAIASFESQVNTFNKSLQTGLSEVTRFERITELSLNITTNFDNVGFYKKLTQMDEVVREQQAEFGKDYSRDLPSATVAHALRDFLGVIHTDGSLEFNPAEHITLAGAVTENSRHKPFRNAAELENISSDGLTSVILISLLSGLLNTIRSGEPVYVPWVTDEVGKFDSRNFVALMELLRDNRIDVVTASPELGITQLGMFAQRYVFADRGEIRHYKPKQPRVSHSVVVDRN